MHPLSGTGLLRRTRTTQESVTGAGVVDPPDAGGASPDDTATGRAGTGGANGRE